MDAEHRHERERGNGEKQSLRRRKGEADEAPDVVLDVPNVSVDDIHLNVEELSARVSLDAAVAEKLVRLRAGVDVDLGKVELEIKGVQAEAHLRVKLDNVARIIEEALTTLRNSSELVEALTGAVGETVGQVGDQLSGSKRTGPTGRRAKRVIKDVDVSGRASALRDVPTAAATKLKRGFAQLKSALPGNSGAPPRKDGDARSEREPPETSQT